MWLSHDTTKAVWNSVADSKTALAQSDPVSKKEHPSFRKENFFLSPDPSALNHGPPGFPPWPRETVLPVPWEINKVSSWNYNHYRIIYKINKILQNWQQFGCLIVGKQLNKI